MVRQPITEVPSGPFNSTMEDVSKHQLVPKHSKLSDAEKQKLLERYGVSIRELPRITRKDSAISRLSAKAGDVIKIERVSRTAGLSHYYRVVEE